jgi:hypothetical protein
LCDVKLDFVADDETAGQLLFFPFAGLLITIKPIELFLVWFGRKRVIVTSFPSERRRKARAFRPCVMPVE